jgi:hypothetical protein
VSHHRQGQDHAGHDGGRTGLLRVDRAGSPFPVGYLAFPVTHLPDRDGVSHGRVKRSPSAPNRSYFTGWTDTGDRIAWDLEAETDGRYEAALSYVCAAGHVGSTLELSPGESRLRGKATEPHDPPARGRARPGAAAGGVRTSRASSRSASAWFTNESP